MSKLGDNVVSLETAKRLHEAGIDVDSYAYYCIGSGKTKLWDVYHIPIESWAIPVIIYPAPTFEELDLIDPLEINGKLYRLRMGRSMNHYWVNYQNQYDDKNWLIDTDRINPVNDHKLCEVGAEILIKLKKEGYIDG